MQRQQIIISSPPLQVALRRQQAQEEDLGICSPVALSGPGVMVKNEVEADCLFSVEGRSMTTSSPSNPSSLAVTGEILPTVIQLLPCHAVSPPSSRWVVVSKQQLWKTRKSYLVTLKPSLTWRAFWESDLCQSEVTQICANFMVNIIACSRVKYTVFLLWSSLLQTVHIWFWVRI